MYEIINFASHCPKCDIRLLDASFLYTHAEQCPRCKEIYSAPYIEDSEAAYIIVTDNIEKKLYK